MKRFGGIAICILAFVFTTGIANRYNNSVASIQTTGINNEPLQDGPSDLHNTFLHEGLADWHRKIMSFHKKATPFFRGDYYPLLQSSTSPDDWSAMQFHSNDLNAGMVMFYRRPQSPYTNARFFLHGLSSNDNYQIEIDGDSPIIVKGNELMGAGLQVTAELPPTTNIIFYKRVTK